MADLKCKTVQLKGEFVILFTKGNVQKYSCILIRKQVNEEDLNFRYGIIHSKERDLFFEPRIIGFVTEAMGKSFEKPYGKTI